MSTGLRGMVGGGGRPVGVCGDSVVGQGGGRPVSVLVEGLRKRSG